MDLYCVLGSWGLDADAAESRPGMSWLARLGKGRWFDRMEKWESGGVGDGSVALYGGGFVL